jgi:hypothetical protein
VTSVVGFDLLCNGEKWFVSNEGIGELRKTGLPKEGIAHQPNNGTG